jgi:hypothetical protein
MQVSRYSSSMQVCHGLLSYELVAIILTIAWGIESYGVGNVEYKMLTLV